MMKPALQYLVLRSLGAPAVLLSLAMQGVFRGLKDTKTPLYATGIIILHFFDGELYILEIITFPNTYTTTIKRKVMCRKCSK